jgi:transposase, IS5 family
VSQISFSDAEYAGKRKKTRRELFLEEMEQVVPWKVLLKIIEPHYPVAGRGRKPYALESMLRVHLMQNWFALSDPAMEEALYEMASLRSFARLNLNEPIPDETTILNFRHLLEANDLAEDIFKAVNGCWRTRACCSSAAASSTPPSLPRPAPRRTLRASEIPRCTRPRKATSGSSG